MDVSSSSEMSVWQSRQNAHMNTTYPIAAAGELIGEPARAALHR
jgi:hypothetical protein